MKRIFAVILTLLVLCSAMLCTPASAKPLSDTKIVVEYLENGDYIETITAWDDAVTRSSITGSKTRNYKNSSGTILWSVTVTGKFSYNGYTAFCDSASHSTTSPGSAWSIKSASSRRSAASAIADAVATFTSGSTTKDYSMSVTLTCSKTGTLS